MWEKNVPGCNGQQNTPGGINLLQAERRHSARAGLSVCPGQPCLPAGHQIHTVRGRRQPDHPLLADAAQGHPVRTAARHPCRTDRVSRRCSGRY
jgi:hypothetical protein